ncbi:MAG: hypothetical protein LQ341_006318 [Variospora aurantia]|nr:MAG: hypothetical protein LQ341_006318 [Variospora aurantia]
MVAASGPNLAKVKTRPGPATHIRNGEYSAATRALALGSYFISGCMAINASQFLGAPLYLVNEDWYNAWIAFTKQSWGLLTTSMTQCWAPTVVRVSGHKSVRGELLKTIEGNLLSNFPERLILIANHQIYTDWLYLWWIGYTNGMHGRIYVVLKESLRRIPIIGWGMQFSQFIFLKRNWEQDKDRLAEHLQKLNGDTRKPMWLMLFPEGTNLHPVTRKASKKWAEKNEIPDMQHQLLPRSKGLQFCIQQLRKTVPYVYDCTIAYEGVPTGQYASEIFTIQAAYFGGKPPKSVNMYWRRFDVWSIPADDDRAFDNWLRARWIEKDQLLDHYQKTGRFPADTGVDELPDGRKRRGAGYIETEIKPNKWYEYLQIFAPVGLLALVLYMFYGGLPKRFVKDIGKQVAQKSQVPGAIEGPEDIEEMIKSTPRIVEVDSTNASAVGETPGRVAVSTQPPGATKKAIKKLRPKQQGSREAPGTKAKQGDGGAVRAKPKKLGVTRKTAAPKPPKLDAKPATNPPAETKKSNDSATPKKLEIKGSLPEQPAKLKPTPTVTKPNAGETPKKLEVKHSPPEKPAVNSAPTTTTERPAPAKKFSPQKLDVRATSAPKLGGKSKPDPAAKAGGKKPGAAGPMDKENHPPKKLEVKPKTAGAARLPEKGKIRKG